MTTRIIPVTPVDATAHVYRVTSGEIVRVFVQDRAGLGQVEFRTHADDWGLTLADAPAGQVWAEVKAAVVGLGALATLNSVDLFTSKVIKQADIKAGQLAHGVRYWPPFAESLAATGSSDPLQMLIDGMREIRSELTKLGAFQIAPASSAHK